MPGLSVKVNGVVGLIVEVDLLSKLRLHTSAAYIRKHSISSEVGQITQVGRNDSDSVKGVQLMFMQLMQQHTTIYTNCAKCRKPLINPIIRRRDGRNMADFGYCSRCKQLNVKCTIW